MEIKLKALLKDIDHYNKTNGAQWVILVLRHLAINYREYANYPEKYKYDPSKIIKAIRAKEMLKSIINMESSTAKTNKAIKYLFSKYQGYYFDNNGENSIFYRPESGGYLHSNEEIENTINSMNIIPSKKKGKGKMKLGSSIAIEALTEKIKKLTELKNITNFSIQDYEKGVEKLKNDQINFQIQIDELNETINYLKNL